MDATIISVGTELVIGQCTDTNSAWLARELTGLGVRVTRHLTVGDDLTDITSAILTSQSDSDLVIITGGLGPTPDDLTREGIAQAFGVGLHEDRQALAAIEAFFERWQRPMPDSNRVQALMPEGCEFIPNPRGTAPGIRAVYEGTLHFALPGVPAEMRAMFDEAVRPLLIHRAGGAAVSEVNLHCFGISEAKLGDALADMMTRDRNPLVGTTASQAVLTVRIVARGANPDEARQLVLRDANEVRGRLKHLVFGEGQDTLATVVGQHLLASARTISTAESCTGGMLGAWLTETPGSSGYFSRGYVTYSNEAKIDLLGIDAAVLAEHGAVSEPIAAAMAEGCRRRARSDLGLSVTGIAGPDGGSAEKPVGLVFIGLADEAGVSVQRFLFGNHLTRAEIRDRSCKSALNILRLRLIEVGH